MGARGPAQPQHLPDARPRSRVLRAAALLPRRAAGGRLARRRGHTTHRPLLARAAPRGQPGPRHLDALRRRRGIRRRRRSRPSATDADRRPTAERSLPGRPRPRRTGAGADQPAAARRRPREAARHARGGAARDPPVGRPVAARGGVRGAPAARLPAPGARARVARDRIAGPAEPAGVRARVSPAAHRARRDRRGRAGR